MNLIDFLFALIARFIDMQPGKVVLLKEQASAWVEKNKDHKIWGKIIKYQNEWYAQVLLCFVFLFAVKSISRWMLAPDTSSNDELEDSDELDDEDDHEEFNAARKSRTQKLNARF